ncbi:MAG: hypothetical protein ABI809_12680 [Caldimonas sp.]
MNRTRFTQLVCVLTAALALAACKPSTTTPAGSSASGPASAASR